MRSLRLSVFLFLLAFCANPLFSQQRMLDSLQNLVKILPDDSNKVNALLALGAKQNVVLGHSKGNGPGLDALNNAFHLAQRLNYKKGEFEALSQLGSFSEERSDFRKAISYYKMAIEVAELANNKEGIYRIYGQILNACFYLGDYPLGMETALKGLTLAERSNDKNRIANYYSLLGALCSRQNNLPAAKDYFTKYLKLAKELGNEGMIAHAYGGISEVYEMEGKPQKALEYQFMMLAMYEKINEKHQKVIKDNIILIQISTTYNNIAELCEATGDIKTALEYSNKCLELSLKIGSNKYDLANYYVNNGQLYTKAGDYVHAEESLNKGLDLAKSIGHKEDMKEAYGSLAELYEGKGDFRKAYDFHKKYSTLKDTLLNEKSTRQLTEMNAKYESEKKDKELLMKDAEIKNDELQAKHDLILRNVLLAGSSILLVLALFILRSYSLKRKANIAISKQKEIIEHKNKEITDSIQYAKRIQKAMLASDKLLDRNLKDYFVFYKPKDIVSGDFYWAAELNPENGKQFALCTADCTGHGVPGAFMSLINISLLNEAMIEKKIAQPHKVLNYVRTAIIHALNTDLDEESKDGMDCVLCVFDFEKMKLYYAAANNSFYIIRNNALIVCKADKIPVGRSPRESTEFTGTTFDLQKGDLIYALTDGYPDQFGGPKGKKLMYKQLERILMEHSSKPMSEQKLVLAKAIEDWKGMLEQVDDILLIGIRV